MIEHRRPQVIEAASGDAQDMRTCQAGRTTVWSSYLYSMTNPDRVFRNAAAGVEGIRQR
jgi:hypothetical protein